MNKIVNDQVINIHMFQKSKSNIKIQQLFMWNMPKLIATICKVVILLIVFLFCFKIGLYKQAILKSQYNKNISPQIKLFKSTQVTNEASNSQILQHLEDLTAIPLLGRLYQQDRMFQLYRLQRYKEALELANEVLESPFRQKSFNLWHLKTKTEIQLDLLEEAQQSFVKMSMLSKKEYQNILTSYYGDILIQSINIKNRKKTVLQQKGLELNTKQTEKYLAQKQKKEREDF